MTPAITTMAPPISVSRKISVDETPRPRTVKRSRSLNLTDRVTGSHRTTPARKLNLNPVTGSTEHLPFSHATSPDAEKHFSKDRRDAHTPSFFSKNFFSIRRQKKESRGRRESDGGQKQLLLSGEGVGQHDSGHQQLPRHTINSDALCHPTPVTPNRNRNDITSKNIAHSSSQSTLWYVNDEATGEVNRVSSSDTNNKPPQPVKKILSSTKDDVDCMAGNEADTVNECINEGVRSIYVNSPLATSPGQLFTITEENIKRNEVCVDSSQSESDSCTIKDEEEDSYDQHEEPKVSPALSPILLRCQMSTIEEYINKRWTIAEMQVWESSEEVDVGTNDTKNESIDEVPPPSTPQKHDDSRSQSPAPASKCLTPTTTTTTSSLLPSTSQESIEEDNATTHNDSMDSLTYVDNKSGINTSQSLMELSLCGRQETPEVRSTRTMSMYDRERMKPPALNRSVSLSLGWRGSSEKLVQ